MSTPVYKARKSKGQRFLRLLSSVFDPRAIAQGIKVRNYYNYTNGAEIGKARKGQGVKISPTASFANAQNIEMGNDISIGANTSLWAGNGSARIVIGNHVLIAPSVMITAANYRFNKPDRSPRCRWKRLTSSSATMSGSATGPWFSPAPASGTGRSSAPAPRCAARCRNGQSSPIRRPG